VPEETDIVPAKAAKEPIVSFNVILAIVDLLQKLKSAQSMITPCLR